MDLCLSEEEKVPGLAWDLSTSLRAVPPVINITTQQIEGIELFLLQKRGTKLGLKRDVRRVWSELVCAN